MRWGCACILLAVGTIARPASAVTVTDGGPYEVDEGSAVDLAVLLADVVGETSITWDLDSDEGYGDAVGERVTFQTLPDMDGPTVWVVHVSVIDEADATVLDIPIWIRNVPPRFVNPPGPVVLCVGQSWSADLRVTDPVDPIVVSVDQTMPAGATFRAEPPRIAWTPDAAAAGHHDWVVTASDDDGGVTELTISFDVVADCGAGEVDGGADGPDDGGAADADGGAAGDAAADGDADADTDADTDGEALDGDEDATPPTGCGCVVCGRRSSPGAAYLLIVPLVVVRRRLRHR